MWLSRRHVLMELKDERLLRQASLTLICCHYKTTHARL